MRDDEFSRIQSYLEYLQIRESRCESFELLVEYLRDKREDIFQEAFEEFQSEPGSLNYANARAIIAYPDSIFAARFEGGLNSLGGTATARLSPRITAFAQSRLRFTDGVGDSREGVEGGIRAGVSRVFTERFTAGIYGLAQFGDQQTSTSTLDSRIAGGGLFGRYRLSEAGAPVSLTAGLGGMWEHGSHDFAMGGATGSFGSDRYSLQGQLSASTRVEAIDVSLDGNVDWSVLQRDGFTMSDASSVPSNRIETVDLSMSIGLSRTIAVADFGPVSSLTPSVNGSFGYAFSSETGYAVDGELVTFEGAHASFGGGLAFGFFNGATLDLTASANGLATDTRRYVFNGNLRVPLN